MEGRLEKREGAKEERGGKQEGKENGRKRKEGERSEGRMEGRERRRV